MAGQAWRDWTEQKDALWDAVRRRHTLRPWARRDQSRGTPVTSTRSRGRQETPICPRCGRGPRPDSVAAGDAGYVGQIKDRPAVINHLELGRMKALTPILNDGDPSNVEGSS